MKSPMRVTALLCLSLAFLLFNSCKHDSGAPAPTVVKQWSGLAMKAAFEVPAPAGRTEEGDANIKLMSDNSLVWDFHLHNLSPSDQLTAAHIHAGDAVTAGPVFINLSPTFSGSGASGTVANLRQGQIDTLLNMPIYINVHSTQAPGGIARSQMEKTLSFAMDVALNSNNETPPFTSTCTGLAVLRLAGDSLISKVTFSGMEVGDTMTVSHIHRGAAGVPGPVRIFLAFNTADFGLTKTIFLPDSMKTMVTSEACYVNAHSKLKGGGKIRGQIR